MLAKIPYILIVFRLVAGFWLSWLAYVHLIDMLFVGVYIGACLSDLLDGIIARRLGVSSKFLRIADSSVDLIFYLNVLAIVCMCYTDAITDNVIGLLGLLATQLLSWGYSLYKFGRLTSYHSYLAKLFGLALCVGCTVLFMTGTHSWNVIMICGVGILSNLEDIVITHILRHWDYDILSISHALQKHHHGTST